MPEVDATPPTGRWGFVKRLEVTFRDLDLAGHVNNSVVFSWMETVRLHHYMEVSGIVDPREIDFILAESAARYFVPVRFQHKVLAEVAPSYVGRTSWELLYRFVDEPTGTLLMRGRSVQVAYDYKTLQKKPLSAPLRERLLKTLVPSTSEGWPSPERRSA